MDPKLLGPGYNALRDTWLRRTTRSLGLNQDKNIAFLKQCTGRKLASTMACDPLPHAQGFFRATGVKRDTHVPAAPREPSYRCRC